MWVFRDILASAVPVTPPRRARRLQQILLKGNALVAETELCLPVEFCPHRRNRESQPSAGPATSCSAASGGERVGGVGASVPVSITVLLVARGRL